MDIAYEVDSLLQRELDCALKGLGHLKHGLALRSLDSTNDVAIHLEKMGHQSGTVVVALQQNLGRGRFKRSWHMGVGDLAMSVILRPPEAPKNLAVLSMMPAVAIKDALASLDISVRLKWPNDIIIAAGALEPKLDYFLNFRKVGGILVENIFVKDSLAACIMGIGLNITLKHSQKPRIPHIGSIADLMPGMGREQCLAAILRMLDQLILAVNTGGFQERLVASYSQSLETIGKEVVVETADGRLCGRATRVQADGSLVINDGRENHVVFAGEVLFVR